MEVETSPTELRQSLEKILGLARGIAKGLGKALDEPVAPRESELGPEPREGTPDEGVGSQGRVGRELKQVRSVDDEPSSEERRVFPVYFHRRRTSLYENSIGRPF